MKRLLVLLVLLVLNCAACDPPVSKPRPSEAAAVTRDNPAAATLWPAMLQHCERSPLCDPLSDFGDGAGQASGVTGATAWFVETSDVAKRGGEDQGASITLSVFGPRGHGGPAGRPLTIDEIPPSLRAGRDRKSWLWVQYRIPRGGAPEPYFLALQSAHLFINVPDARLMRGPDKIGEATEDHVAGFTWRGGETGARVEIGANGKSLWVDYAHGEAGYAPPTSRRAPGRPFAPWTIYTARNLRSEPMPELLAVLAAGQTLSLRISAPDGVMLEDAIYADGFDAALAMATAALADPVIAAPLPDRCKDVAGKADAFWLDPQVSPARLACDPRTLEQRYRDARAAADTP